MFEIPRNSTSRLLYWKTLLQSFDRRLKKTRIRSISLVGEALQYIVLNMLAIKMPDFNKYAWIGKLFQFFQPLTFCIFAKIFIWNN